MEPPERENPFDAVVPDLLPSTTGMELDYRTTDASPHAARHWALRFFLAVGGVGSLVAFTLRAVSEATSSNLFLSIVAFLMALHVIAFYVNGLSRTEITVWALLGPSVWLLSTVTVAGLHVILWLLAGALAIHLSHAVVTHQAMWMHAHPQLDRDTRKRWRQVWKHATFRGTLRAFASPSTSVQAAPAIPSHAMQSAEKQTLATTAATASALTTAEKRELFHYHISMGFVGLVVLTATLTALAVPAPFINGLAGLAVYATLMIIYGAYQAQTLHPSATWREMIRHITDAWGSWLAYNAKQTDAPGVFQSPAGSFNRRFVTTYYMSLIIAIALVPVCAYFPVPVLIYGNGPWIEAGARSWLLSDKFENPSKHAIPVPNDTLKRLPEAQRQQYIKAHQSVSEWNARRNAAAAHLEDYEGYLMATLKGMSRGDPFFFFSMTASVLLCHAAIGIFLLSTSFALGTRRLLHHARTLEGTATTPGSYHRTPHVSLWEAYVSRLRQSCFETLDANGRPVRESDHLFLGRNASMDYPILLDRRILNEHAHITGDTGSGKTALGIAPLVAQLIGMPQTSVVVIDLKGDIALFEAVQIRTQEINRLLKKNRPRLRFKWFTNHQGRHTFAFNPFLQQYFRDLTVQQKASMFLQSLGLDYGEGWGLSYYSAIHRDTLVKIMRDDPRIRSFRDISRYIANDLRSRRKDLNIEKRQHEEGTHLYTVVDILAAQQALNVTADTAPNEAVLRHQIDMSSVVREPQVVYFYLSAPLEESSVRETAKLALHSLLTAAVQRGRSKHRVYVFVDEFQQVVSQNLEIVLRQAREYGISVILANHTISDLKKSEHVNLIPTVQANTRLRQVFSASDVIAQEMLSLASGEQSFYTDSFAWTANRSGGGDTYTLVEKSGPRLSREDIIRFSDREQHSLVQITRGRGLTQFGGRLFPVVSDFHISLEEYERRGEAAWPTFREGAYIPPREAAEPIRPTSPTVKGEEAFSTKPVAPEPPKDDLEERLDSLFQAEEPSE